MVVKGLDFEHVNLVGITDGDGLLSFADFRVNERAFQLMEQVSGRAGRKNGNGKVMIQVTNTHHPTLAFVKAHDYQKMYAFELEGRKAYHYPPFTRIIYVQVKHVEKDKALAAANIIAKALHGIKTIEVNGPSQPPIDRVRNKYLWDIQIKLPKNNSTNLLCKQTLSQQIIILKNHDSFKGVIVVVDVDGI
jgi:primosomal protein N' (replication factor Y)